MKHSDIANKRKEEMRLIHKMIQVYCRRHHAHKHMCSACLALYQYAEMRIQKCPMMHEKTFCSFCKIHCYEPCKREEIKKVMRFAGPCMLWHHPIIAVKHLVEAKKERKNK